MVIKYSTNRKLMTFATLKVFIYEEKLEEYLNEIFKKYFKSLNLYLYKYDRELEKVRISTIGQTKEEINFNESTTLSKIERDLESLIYSGFLRSNLDCSVSIEEDSFIKLDRYVIDFNVNWSISYPG